MGAGLTGLTTAFRLASHGFHVSIVDQGQDQPLLAPVSPLPPHTRSEKNLSSPGSTEKQTQFSHDGPFVIHGFQDATWALLRELQTISLLTSTPPVTLEFMTDAAQQPVHFNPAWTPAPFHTLIGLLRFQGMPFSERWTLIKKLEQYWEGDLELPQDLESQSAKAWLTTLGQSEQTIQNIWDVLCQFILGSDTHHCSAQYFKTLLVQYFLSTRQHNRTVIPSLDEETLLIAPLRKSLAAQHVHIHQHSTISYFHYDASGLSGVTLNDGTQLTANYYISALPRHRLIACLSDRILTKYAYFSNLTQLHEHSSLMVQLEIPEFFTKPRLLLSPNTYNWISVQPLHQTSNPSSRSTRISCVKMSNQPLADSTDHDILSELSRLLPSPINQHLHPSKSIRITRTMRTILTCHPDTSVFRPIQKSPLANLFLAGPWTDTGSPASRESSILSANLCTQALLDSITRH